MTTEDLQTEASFPVADIATAPAGMPDSESEPPRLHQWRGVLVAGCAYLLLSVLLWWNVWSTHPTSVTTCGCGDSSEFTWFLAWPAYAISHGLSPFYSTAMGYPHGVNLLANASDMVTGILGAPITWIFGPIATFNVALTLGPVASALAMFVLLRRWVTWAPAAFVGGLFYGFSAAILISATAGFVMISTEVVPPLIVICLDELLIRQRRRPVVTGIVLGLLVTLQFFIYSEVLLITAVMAAVGVVLIVAYAALTRPEVLRARVHHAVVGLASGAVTALVLLAYPVWYAVAGPAHISGLIWPGNYFAALRNQSIELKDLVVPLPAASGVHANAVLHLGSSYQGPLVSFQYFGIGVLLVLVGGYIAWPRDRRLWLFGAIGLVSIVFSLGATKPYLPWEVFKHLPLFDNVDAAHFVLITYLAVAVMLGLIVEHTYVNVSGRPRTAGAHGQPRSAWWSRMPRASGAVAAVIVTLIALVPPAVYLARTVPFTTRPVVLPNWFRTVAPHLAGHQVLLTTVQPSPWRDNPMTWQAVNRMHYSMVNEGGPAGILQRAGVERPGATVISDATSPLVSSLPTELHWLASTNNIAAVRRALSEWGVTMVVIPDQRSLPSYDQIPSVTLPAALITAATGEPPIYRADAWVWTGVNHLPPRAIPSTHRISVCIVQEGTHGVVAVGAATRCVLKLP